MNTDLAVGFKYSYFKLFFCSFWTWKGKFVVYHGNMYMEVPEALISQWLGKPEGELSTPFAYQFPLGLLILGGIVALGLLTKIFVESDADRVRKLLKNPKYQHALEILSRPEPQPVADQSLSDASRLFERRLTAAVDYLHWEGLSREEAEGNLRLIVRTVPLHLVRKPPLDSQSPAV